MTVDELAREAGTTTRNVRAYQTRGLLPPPNVVGRVGYYDRAHLARLSYIDRLQQRGFSLAAIRDLLAAWDEGKSLTDVLGFEEALTAPWSDEEPRSFTRDELVELFPELAGDDTHLRRAVEVGLLVEKGDCYEAPSPELVRVGAELVASGIPLPATIDEYEKMAADLRRIAERLVKMFEDNVWEPFVAAGFPPDRLPAVTAALQRVRPLASSAVVAELARAMERAVAASTARQTARFMPGASG
ncbi:MAG TPA: MerR family transcriptional regulator [Acidimicrobiales bacterium]|nr:MerR family transcriptional regulator [Acidimicrobiales bacterium]